MLRYMISLWISNNQKCDIDDEKAMKSNDGMLEIGKSV